MALLVRNQAAEIVGEVFREHGQHMVGEINRSGSLDGFFIKGSSEADMLGDIGNMNPESIAGLMGFQTDGIIKILGISPVDGEGDQIGQIRAGPCSSNGP